MMCGRDEEPQPMQQPIEKLLWFVPVAKLWINVVDNER